MLNIKLPSSIVWSLFLMLNFAGNVRANEPVIVGGDTYVSGTNATLNSAAGRDAFLTGFSVDIAQKVEKDIGAAGFDVDVSAPVGGDAYLSGFSIDVAQPVSEDLTAAGFNIHVKQSAVIGGNARLFAGTVTIDAPIAGSLVATTGTLALNGTVTGDAQLVVGTMTFGPNAKINGRLKYSAANPTVIPASVIDPSRVTYQQLASREVTEKARDTVRDTVPAVWWTAGGAILAFAVSIAFLLAFSAALLAFMPERMERLKAEAVGAPVRTMTLGVLGLSMLVGLVPVSAVTLIGIPLIPIAALAAIMFWVLGYIVGAYALATRMLEGFSQQPRSTGTKLLALVFGFIILALINFIPVIGWLINLAVVFLGLGSIMLRAARALVHEDSPVTSPA